VWGKRRPSVNSNPNRKTQSPKEKRGGVSFLNYGGLQQKAERGAGMVTQKQWGGIARGTKNTTTLGDTRTDRFKMLRTPREKTASRKLIPCTKGKRNAREMVLG